MPTSDAQTQTSLRVNEVGAEVAELRSRGVAVEEYDMPGIKTVDGIHDGDGQKAWLTPQPRQQVGLTGLAPPELLGRHGITLGLFLFPSLMLVKAHPRDLHLWIYVLFVVAACSSWLVEWGQAPASIAVTRSDQVERAATTRRSPGQHGTRAGSSTSSGVSSRIMASTAALLPGGSSISERL